MSVLDVFATFDNAITTGDGNTIGLLVTDPTGATYSSGIALPILDGNTREVVVKNPVAGNWVVEARGVRGLATAPNASLPTSGLALPGPVDITITQQQFTLAPIADIQGHAAQAQIESALKNRMMDIFPDGTFRPDANVTRADLAIHLYLNTAMRQSLGANPRFTDVTDPIVRDWTNRRRRQFIAARFQPHGSDGRSGHCQRFDAKRFQLHTRRNDERERLDIQSIRQYQQA